MTTEQTIPKAPSRIGIAFALNNLRRAMWEEALDRNFESEDRKNYFHEFRDSDLGKVLCFYCRSEDVKRWDHLVPITKGGATIRGNLVPSCSTCDDSKGNLDLREWLESERQAAKIRRAKEGTRSSDEIVAAASELRRKHALPDHISMEVLTCWPSDRTELARGLLECIARIERIQEELKASAMDSTVP